MATAQQYSSPVPPDDDAEEVVAEEVAAEDVSASVALTAVDRAQIDAQVATAKQYPRSVTSALKEAQTLATLDAATAESMFYTLKRKENGKTKLLPGPSARLAEVMAYSWGNLRVDADIVGMDKNFVTAMGTCFDLERNIAIRVRVQRRITNKNGVRFSDDMIGVTSNAAISIALRNSVFKVIPRALVDRIYKKAREVAAGEGKTIAETRTNALGAFAKMGVTKEEVFAVLEVKGLDDIGIDELATLAGLRNAINDGELTIDEVFRSTGNSEGTDELNAALGTKKARPAKLAACPTCARTDGTHDPDKSCYSDA